MLQIMLVLSKLASLCELSLQGGNASCDRSPTCCEKGPPQEGVVQRLVEPKASLHGPEVRTKSLNP